MTSPTLTIAIVAQNEAPRLATLLPQLRFADEVLVLDGGSTDGTADVGRRLGASVVERPFDDFAAQRNAALAAAKSEWVFFIDADEHPTAAMVHEIRRRLVGSTASGYRVPIRSTIFGSRFRFSGTQNDVPLRLVRRGSGHWTDAVHERFITPGAVERLDSYLEHVTIPTVQAFVAKMRRYTTLEAQARVKQGRAPTVGSRWLRPTLEVFRRLIWKHGWLDGPAGWRFCLMSGRSEWVLANEHRRLWRASVAIRRTSLEPVSFFVEGATA